MFDFFEPEDGLVTVPAVDNHLRKFQGTGIHREADLLKELADIKKEIAKRDKILKEAEKEAGAAASKTGAKKAAPKKAPAKKASAKKSAE